MRFKCQFLHSLSVQPSCWPHPSFERALFFGVHAAEHIQVCSSIVKISSKRPLNMFQYSSILWVYCNTLSMFLVSSDSWHTQTAVQKTQNLLYALACSEVVLSTRRFFKCIRTHQEYIQGLFRECSGVFEVSQSMLARALSFCKNQFYLQSVLEMTPSTFWGPRVYITILGGCQTSVKYTWTVRYTLDKLQETTSKLECALSILLHTLSTVECTESIF